jgi:hypothetical protein
LIGISARPGSKNDPSRDARISAVLDLLDHPLSSRVRGELADEVDVNSPSGEWLRRGIEEILRNPILEETIPYAVLSAAITSIVYRRRRGLKAQRIGAENLKRALEKYGITVDDRYARYNTPYGDTVIDFALRVNGTDRILRFVEHKTPKGSWYGNQKKRQEWVARHTDGGVPIDVMRTAPTTGRSTVNGIPLEDYMKKVVRQTRRRK